jgi:tetratricopeptide (TPR) repeat protein
MVEPRALKYRAFISYSHADTVWAKWLHRALEGFSIDKDLVGRETVTGAIPKTLRPIFRDRDEFTAGHALSEQTLTALDASQALIVICSPVSAKSRYVNEEVRLFRSRHAQRPVIPLIVGGKPGDAEFECFPASLKFNLDAEGGITDVSVEMLAADACEDGDGKSLALAKVVAGLLGLSSDDIFRRAVRDRRRRQQRWIAGLSVVTVALAGLAVWAEINRREAVTQRTEAVRNFEIAKQGAESLIFDIAQALREQEGMRTETVRKILSSAEQVINQLASKSEQLKRLQGIMLDEFAQTYGSQGDTAKQEEMARKARAIFDRLATTGGNDSASQHFLSMADIRIGDALQSRGKIDEALASYRKSLVVATSMAKTYPDDTLWQRRSAVSLERVGDVLLAQGKSAEALAYYQQSVTMRERLALAEPDDIEGQRDLAVGFDKVGEALMAQNDTAAALKSYSDSLAIKKRLASADPNNTLWQKDLAIAYLKQGEVESARSNYVNALRWYKPSLAIMERQAKADPGNAVWQRQLSVLYNKVGGILSAQGHYQDGLNYFKRGLAIIDSLVMADSDNAEFQRDRAVGLRLIGLSFTQLGEAAKALATLKEGRAIIVQLKHQAPDNAQLTIDLSWFDREIANAQK